MLPPFWVLELIMSCLVLLAQLLYRGHGLLPQSSSEKKREAAVAVLPWSWAIKHVTGLVPCWNLWQPGCCCWARLPVTTRTCWEGCGWAGVKQAVDLALSSLLLCWAQQGAWKLLCQLSAIGKPSSSGRCFRVQLCSSVQLCNRQQLHLTQEFGTLGSTLWHENVSAHSFSEQEQGHANV